LCPILSLVLISTTEKCEAVDNSKEEGGRENTDSGLLKHLGLVPNTTSSITTTQNSNTIVVEPEITQEPNASEQAVEEENLNEVALLPKDRPVQKNKKKCWSCKSRLELAQRELGLCKCGKNVHLLLV